MSDYFKWEQKSDDNKDEILPEIEPMNNEKCSVLVHGYAHAHSRVSSLPMDIARLCVSYYSMWFDLKIIYCDDETGNIDMNNYETMCLRIDSQLTLEELAQDVTHKMFQEAVKKRYNELLHCSTERLKEEFTKAFENFEIASEEEEIDGETMKSMIDDLMYEMTACDEDLDWNDYQSKEKGHISNMPFVHIWMKFKDAKAIYPIGTSRVTVKEEWFDDEDGQRWIEMPNDYLKTKIGDLRYYCNDFDCLVIERCIINKPSDWQTGQVTWPKQKGDDWRETLQTGDIINAKDIQEKWYESMIRYVYPKDHETMSGKCVVHFIGWNIKWDEILDIDSEKIAKRHSYCIGPHIPRKKNTKHNSSNQATLPSQYTSNEDIDLQRAIAASLSQM